VPSDHTGIDLDALEEALRTRDVRAIYVVADGHNPLGVSLNSQKRSRLAQLAETNCVPIIEDDPCGFLQYNAEMHPAVRATVRTGFFMLVLYRKLLHPHSE
jgi:2-aminoadipate transaminase